MLMRRKPAEGEPQRWQSREKVVLTEPVEHLINDAQHLVALHRLVARQGEEAGQEVSDLISQCQATHALDGGRLAVVEAAERPQGAERCAANRGRRRVGSRDALADRDHLLG